MRIEVKHYVNRVKYGYAARSPALSLVAHGHSPEAAKLNLERVVGLYLSPFVRDGTLGEELEQAGLKSEGESVELSVVVI